MTVQLHSATSVKIAGVPLEEAAAAVVLLHGRGSDADDILSLASQLGEIDGVAYMAPEAANHTWYPLSFLAPLEANEPYLTSALTVVDQLVEHVLEARIPLQRLMLLGFSQGACLTLEYAAQNARRYGAVVGLSGGLIGPEGTPRAYAGSFDGTPVYLGCSDIDPHIPLVRVRETEEVLSGMGAKVASEIFKGGAHTVYQEELDQVRKLLLEVALKS